MIRKVVFYSGRVQGVGFRYTTANLAKRFHVAGYVQNLDEEDYYTGTQENFGLSGFRLRPTPRTIGGSIAYRF